MKKYLEVHPWKIVEDGFHPALNEVSESIFSLGNGHMGHRGNFEEKFSGKTLQGTYYGGVYYPDKTRVGWWKNGYPEYFAKVLNAVNWIGVNIRLGNEKVNMAKVNIEQFERTLDMKRGLLLRSVKYQHSEGGKIQYNTERFCSIADQELGMVRIKIEADFTGPLDLTPFLDFDVVNQDSNYDEQFWIPEKHTSSQRLSYIQAKTKKTGYHVGAAMQCQIIKNGRETNGPITHIDNAKYVGQTYKIEVDSGDQIELIKYVATTSSRYHIAEELESHLKEKVNQAVKMGYDHLYQAHVDAWSKKWSLADIQIDGDVQAQQGIRFNIFQLLQTYTGDDAALNIGPKGFTGEKYGGSTYWDTEAYCLPFYLGTCDASVGYNLLKYRYNHLSKAIENAASLGFRDGAALYPMVTMNGEECHNEWEITFEEIHRNGAIAFAIYNYIRYTYDDQFLVEGGLEVLIGIARFWAQRFHFSEAKNKYVILGVTGPNEYENNVNNNWYTNYIARWCLQFTGEMIAKIRGEKPDHWTDISAKTTFVVDELDQWKEIKDKVFLPEEKSLGIYLQQEGYMDKEQILVNDLPANDRPINQKWSWDRILRSCFIKQADVLQGLYFFEDHFSKETIERNFDFYEPRTVHESSLSPCVHAIQAAYLGREEKAYEMYLRTSRLDLDDYNNDTEDGLHITSMAGTWLSIVEGFAGMRIRENQLTFRPMVPKQWQAFRFRLMFRDNLLELRFAKEDFEVINLDGPEIEIKLDGATCKLLASEAQVEKIVPV